MYGGRGTSRKLSVSVDNQIGYLKAAKKLIESELKALGGKTTEFNGPNAGGMYKALAQKFQAKFPTYELPYMIEYGAYGLIQSEMQKLK